MIITASTITAIIILIKMGKGAVELVVGAVELVLGAAETSLK